MNRNRILTIMRKDMKEVVSNRMVVIPLVIVPLLLCIVLPAVLVAVAFSMEEQTINGVEMIEKLLPNYWIPEIFSSLMLKIVYIVLNYTFIPYFMIIPIMVASIIAANSIVGEKERKTLETLLYTPVTNKEFMVAKLLGSFLPACSVSLFGFIGYFVVSNALALCIKGILVVRALIWIPAILLLSPAVSLLGLSVTLIASLKAKSFMEAQQLSGVLVVPFIGLVIVQITGLVTFNILVLIALSIVLFAIDYVIISKIGPRFSREKILSTL